MTNRQEVAKKLRKVNQGYGGWFITSDNAIYEIGKAIHAQGKPLDFFFNRLADLIDPTCHMSWEYGNGDDETDEYMEEIAGTHEDTVACHCHMCDEVFRYDRGIVPNYCPSCGARVVRDE